MTLMVVMNPSIVDNVVNMEFDVLSKKSFLMSGKAKLIGCVCVINECMNVL